MALAYGTLEPGSLSFICKEDMMKCLPTSLKPPSNICKGHYLRKLYGESGKD